MYYNDNVKANVSLYIALIFTGLLILIKVGLYVFIRCKMTMFDPNMIEMWQLNIESGTRIHTMIGSVYEEYAITKMPRTVVVFLFFNLIRRIMFSVVIIFAN